MIVRGWQTGDLIAWNDLMVGLRQDLYVLDDRIFEASELHCPVPDCACGEVVVDFETPAPRGAA